MGRAARKISQTGVYHVMCRGVGRQDIFESKEDFNCFLSFLAELKHECQFQLYVYCLMSNHVHLLLRELNAGDISAFMQRLLDRYTWYFNHKYDRIGALLAGRFKSEPVENDVYFLTLVRYIHQNPLRAGLVQRLQDYSFSSYSAYMSETNHQSLDMTLVKSLVGKEEWQTFHAVPEPRIYEFEPRNQYSEEQIRKVILLYTQGESPDAIAHWEKKRRNALLHILRYKEGFTIHQLERATGISRGIIAKY